MARYQLTLYAFAILTWCTAEIRTQDYLKEPPSFLKPCKLHGVNGANDDCLPRSIETILGNFKDGIPGLKEVGSFDPFRVKKVRFTQEVENIANMRAELRNVVITGFSKLKVLKAQLNEKDYTFRFQIFLPSIKIQCDSKLKGRILLLNLDSQGTIQSEITDLDYIFTVKTNLKKVDNEYFFDILSINTEIRKIGNFKVKFTNLFNGNKELEDSANELFNQNWRQLYDVMRPISQQTLDTVTLDRYKKIFNYIPARYFFSDLP